MPTPGLKEELGQRERDYGIYYKVYCSREEAKEFKKKDSTPNNVHLDLGSSSNYYRNYKIDLSEEELAKLFRYRQTQYLKTIKNCLVFFVVMIFISLFLYLVPLIF